MNFIYLLKFIATFLITNSHFGSLYPPGLSFLGTGGMTGNALFFFCSGYTLYLSIQKCTRQQNPRPFWKWYAKRLMRIYPSLWIFRLCSALFLSETFTWINFIWPGYWFLNAILLIYPVFYFIVNYLSEHLLIIMGLIYLMLIGSFFYLTTPETGFIIERTSASGNFHCYYLFIVMLLGSLIAKKGNTLKFKFKQDSVLLFLAITFYYGFKGMIIVRFLWYAQLLLPLFLIAVIFYFYKVSYSCIRQGYFSNPALSKKIIYIAGLTLDIYIIQFSCIKFASQYSFPVGYILALVLILTGAILLHTISDYVFNLFRKRQPVQI